MNHLQYDDVGQLVSASGTGESHAYDGNGNRAGGAYQTSANNQLQSDGTYTYEYDREGNRRFRRQTGSNAYVEYVWDHRNRLSSVKLFDNAGALAKRVNYTYDVNDMRIGKQVLAGHTLVLQQRYLYENGEVAYVLDGNQRVTHRYLHGSAVDQVIADESYDASHASTGVSWALADHQRTVRDLVDSRGVVTSHIAYDAFGKMASAQTADQLFAYTGREWDSDAQLYYYRARWYDSGVGRFISADSIGFQGGDANLYRYVGNSPLNFTDPTGLRVQTPQETMAAVTTQGTWDRQTYDAWRRQAEIDQYLANLDPVQRWYVETRGGLPVTPHATWAHVQENWRRSAQLERYWRESLASAAERERLLAAQEFAGSFIPFVGEVLDARVLFGPDSTIAERTLAGLSLTANLLTAGVLPNFGGVARATSRLSRVNDILADTSRWADEAFFAPGGAAGYLDPKSISDFTLAERLDLQFKHQALINSLQRGDVAMPSGAASARLMGELTAATGREVGLIRLGGKRVLRLGDADSIFMADAGRVIAHTHPSGILQFSGEVGGELGDIPSFLRYQPRQRSSVLIAPDGAGVRLPISR